MLKLSILDQSPVMTGNTHREALSQTLQLAQAADSWGYTRYWVAEHHNSIGLASSSPEVLISTLAARTSRIRVGSGGVLLPHYSAYKVAENFRVLDALYPGRIDLGIGRAPGGTPHTAKALRDGKADIFEGLDRFPEQLVDLRAFLTDTIPAGHRYEGIAASPFIPTVPQMWLLGSTGQSGVYAAGLGAAFCFAHFINGSGGVDVVRKYVQEFQPSSLNVVPQAMAGVYVVCADSSEEAERQAAVVDLMLLKTEKGMQGSVPTLVETERYPYTEGDRLRIQDNRSRMIVGEPKHVQGRLQQLAAAYRIDEVMVITSTADFAARLRSYELLAEVCGLKAQVR
ncbi:Limonene 1,2-monooxygenase [compost metagenome]